MYNLNHFFIQNILYINLLLAMISFYWLCTKRKYKQKRRNDSVKCQVQFSVQTKKNE